MILKPGYQQTEIGAIPEDWELKMLGDIGESLIGLTYAPADVAAEGTLVLRSSNIQNDRLTFDDNVYVRSAVPQKIMVQEGDLLICVRNGSRDLIGKCAVIDDRAAGATFGAFMAVFRSRKNHFVSHQFQSQLVKKQINEHLGATINQITNRSLNSFCIPVPASTDEQVVIAEALSDVDALIDSLEALLTKKRNIKTGVMQELLTGRTRLPGFSDDWQTRRIDSFTSCTSGGTPSTLVAEYWGGPIRWMSSGELNLKRVREVDGRITEAGLHNSSTKMVPAKCVLIGLAGQGKTRGTAATNFVELCTNQSIAAILPSKSHDSAFLYYVLDTKYEELRGLSDGGGGRGGLNLSIIKAIQVTLPGINEQKAIAAVLSDIDDEIEALEKRLAKTRDLKQGMAQELLTGRTRLV